MKIKSSKKGQLPNLGDFKKTVPKGGLGNPGLRKGVGKVDFPKLKAKLFPKKRK